ncbi:MAG: serine/threonine protein kinase, partial [Kofleriaceae bacterium]|nr:serine/threonine protein kinase [Kofleriaceae bacterium]
MCASHADRDRQGSAGRGRLLADRFELGAALGTGGMGVVYQALDRRTGEQVALKAMRGDDADALVRFKNEFRLCADLRHRNLVRLGELIEADDQLFFTMELVVGVDVLSWVRSPAWASAGPDRTPTAPRGLPVARSRRRSTGRVGPAFVEDRLRAAFRQIAAGVGALHAGRRVHRDLKPSNILVTADGRVVILDFGLVVPHVVERPHSDAVAVGTVAYMAPEQAAARPVGPAADWYAVGAMLYEALAGRLPVEGDDPGSLLAAKLHHDAPPVATFAPAAPEDLAGVGFTRLADRRPDRRVLIAVAGAGAAIVVAIVALAVARPMLARALDGRLGG